MHKTPSNISRITLFEALDEHSYHYGAIFKSAAAPKNITSDP
jgi:hypothetical protein